MIDIFRATLIHRMIQYINREQSIYIKYEYGPDMFLSEAINLVGIKIANDFRLFKTEMFVTFNQIELNGEVIYSTKMDDDSYGYDDVSFGGNSSGRRM